MKDTWSLDSLYLGYDDEKFLNDIQTLKQAIEGANAFSKSLSHEDELQTLKDIVAAMETIALLEYKLFSYVNLRQTTDTSDSETISNMDYITNIANNGAKADAIFRRYISDVEDLECYFEKDEVLKEYSYLLTSIKKDGVYLLSSDVEEVLSKMNQSSGAAWEMMRDYLTSILEIDYNGEKITLPAVRNLAYDEDGAVRKAAYDAELKAYDKIKDAISFSLNNIKSQVITECELRGFDSPLSQTLYNARMKQETLDALLEAMREYMPVFRNYLKRKGELLGYKNGLPFYELFAPMGSANKKFTIDEAKHYLVDHFRPFASDLADMIQEAFDHRWIDFYPRKGKVGGAFCYNLPFIKQSRILTNFDGALGDVVTLAHELGHAYHGMMIENHRILNCDYSMPVAETASTFNENIIMNAIIDDADKKTKFSLIENQLQDLTQIICDIYSRFLFESEVFERRKNEFLFPAQLEEIMLQAQKEAYGDGLDPECLHPFMWVNKSHYYSSHISFYNFPYAFGGLFARGLVVKYQENPDTFVDSYRKMLHETTICNVEDVAKIMDIDLTQKEFWVSALETAKSRIEEFIELSKDPEVWPQ